MNSVYEAADYAGYLANLKGVKGLFSMPPVYFKPATIGDLVDTIAMIAA